MIPALRLQSIEELVQGQGIVTLGEIQERLKVSLMTVRRDVAKMEELGLVVRTRGGVMPPQRLNTNTTCEQRRELEAAEKEAIGAAAASLVATDDALFLSGGTTVLALARHLPSGRHLTVVTNSLLVVSELIGRPGVSTLVSGGRSSVWGRDLVGQVATEMIGRFRANKAFIGAAGITEEGIFSAEPERAGIDRLMVARASTSFVLADHTKFQGGALERVCELGAIGEILTGEAPPAGMVNHLQQAGVGVRIARADA